MEIYFNSERVAVNESISLQEVLQMKVITGSFAVAVNRKFIARGQYAQVMINEGDSIDVVFPMQGG